MTIGVSEVRCPRVIILMASPTATARMWRWGITGNVYTYSASNLIVGSNPIEIVVTAQDGMTTQTYTVTVTRNLAAPAGVTAAAGDGQVTLSWSGVSGADTYDVYKGISSGAYDSTPIGTVSGTTYSFTVTGLKNGTTYYFAVRASNARGSSGNSNEASATPYRTTSSDSPSDPSSGSPNTPSSGDQGTQTGFLVMVDGKPQNQIATATTTKENGKTVLTATVDAAKLTAQLAIAGNNPVIIIPASTVAADKVTAVLTGDAVKAMESKQAVLEVQTPVGNYKLPAAQIVIDRVAAQLGAQANLPDIVVHVDIAKSDSAQVKLAESAAEKGKFSVVAPPVDFKVTATFNGKTVEVDKFSSYVEREIPLPDGADPNKITTAIVLDADGTTHHVPTYVTSRYGKYYAVVSSLTNSTYILIWHPMTFADMEGHWAKEAVKEMASRMVVNGVDKTRFNPNAAITRAEFAAIVVRGLGLSESSETEVFRDVKPGAWYMGAVAKAYEYGIVQGYEDGTFRPNQTMTREEAIVMIARVMKWTGLNANAGDMDATTALSAFPDDSTVSSWAKQAVLVALNHGLIQGRDAGLNPDSPITRAETSAIVERVMMKSKLIDN